MTVNPGFLPVCCICNSKGYHSWRLIGATVDVGCQVIKCVLPLVLCESCFRKRFCCQVQTPYLCGIAVFPPVDPAPEKSKVVSRPYVQSSVHVPTVASSGGHMSSVSQVSSGGHMSSVSQVSSGGHMSSVSQASSVNQVSSVSQSSSVNQVSSVNQSSSVNQVSSVNQSSSVSQASSINHVSSISQPSPAVVQAPIQASSRPTPALPAIAPTPSVPAMTAAPSSPAIAPTPLPTTTVAQPETINYGIDDVLDDIHTSDQPTEPAPAPTVVEDEVCFTLPFRQGGFFRTWLNSFFVINRDMIIMYPNEKRNDRKRKEILLYDATASVVMNDVLNRSILRCPATTNTPSVFRFGQAPAPRGRRTL